MIFHLNINSIYAIMCESLLEALRDYSEEQKDYDKMIGEWIVSFREYSEEPQTCICGQYPINELCYIIHKKTNERLCLGNRCIEHFGTNGICPECKIYEIDKITHHKCNNCRRKESRPTGLVLFGKHKGKEYEVVWNKDESYCDWVLNTPDFKDIHFRNYLLRAFLLKHKTSFKY